MNKGDLTIKKINEVFLKIEAKPHIDYELRDHFKFDVPNAKFMPQYRGRNWNGEIHLYDIRKNQIYIGLLDKIVEFCNSRGYKISFEDNKYYGLPFESNDNISLLGVKDYIKTISNFEPRYYQIEGVFDAIKHNRKLLISPTGSGKSFMIYSIVRYFVEKNKKVLIVVPTTPLVEQMYNDFISYGWNSEEYCHKIYYGKEKTVNLPVIISTWQSIHKLDVRFFENFDVVIGDEAHLFKSKSLINIMTKLHNAKYRFGFTGTLDGTQTHKWVLEGLFGPSYKITKTEELMKLGYLSKLDIQCVILKHKSQKFSTYEDEIKYLISNEKRNKFIKNLSLDLKGNSLILFNRVKDHGEILYEMIKKDCPLNRKIFFIHGGIDVKERELVREITERESDAIIVASYGTFSTGINIKNLHNIVFASPSKSRIRNLQSIGRGLRISKNKDRAILYDIADEIKINNKNNYTLNHFIERIKIYSEENFNYDIFTVKI